MARGGMRFGAGRPGYKATVESLQRVDVRLWARAGAFVQGVEKSFLWHWTRGSEPSGSISVCTRFDNATLSYRVKRRGAEEWHDKCQVIRIGRTACNYGGSRMWFHCPVCHRRCEILCLRADRFACRHCQQVAYRSQSADSYERMSDKIEKLRKRIGTARPKGMRWATYERLRTRCFDIESAADAEFARLAFALIGNSLSR